MGIKIVPTLGFQIPKQGEHIAQIISYEEVDGLNPDWGDQYLFRVEFDVDGEIGILPTSEAVAANTIEEQANTVSRTSMILMRPREMTQGITIAEINVQHGTQSIQKDTGIDYIYFSPNGSAEDAILMFENSTETLMRISMDGGTANIKVDEIKDDEYESAYCHIQKIFVNPGQMVKQGQLLGLSGGRSKDPNKGNATGAHLHFQLKKRKKINGNLPHKLKSDVT